MLKKIENENDAVAARYGGDEFILVVRHIEIEEKIRELAERICLLLRREIEINDKIVQIHGSMGISKFPQDGIRLDELITKADIALYAAKQGGKNRFVIYEDTGIS